MNVVPQIVALKRRDVNIIHIDNYNPALTDEVHKLNKGAARVVAQITRAKDVGDDADGFPGGEAELYPRFLWWGSEDDYLDGVPKLEAAVETTRSLLADLYLMGTDLRLNETHSKYAYVLRSGQEEVFPATDPRWASYRSFPLDSRPLLLIQLWDEDDGLAGADDLLFLASSELPFAPSNTLPFTEYRTLPVDECINVNNAECEFDVATQSVGTFDEIGYSVTICNWSSGDRDGYGIVPPPPGDLPPTIVSGGTTAEECGATAPGWNVDITNLAVEYEYDGSATPVASIDWGDGTVVDATFVPGSGAEGDVVTGTVSGSHVYATGGIFEVSVVVEYDRAGTGPLTDVANLFALVTGARLAGGELQAVGTNGRDKVSIKSRSDKSSKKKSNKTKDSDKSKKSKKSKKNEIKVKLHLDQGSGGSGGSGDKSEFRVPTAEVLALQVLTCDGNDDIRVSH